MTQKVIFKGGSLELTMVNENFLELIFDSKKRPINIFDQITIDELIHVLSIAENQSNINGLIFSSAKSIFIAGADIDELGQMFKSDNSRLKIFFDKVNMAFSKIESLPFPTVACISGFALGGGFELCLACDFRILTSKAVVGLPETKLGIIPGWGGTVRLPRIIGLHKALEWIITGKHKTPNEALSDGAVDAIIDSSMLLKESLNILKAAFDEKSGYKKRRDQKQKPLLIENTEIIETKEFFSKYISSKIGSSYPAPSVALDVIFRTINVSQDEAQAIEHEAFQKLTKTPECRSLMGLFINDQYISSKAKRFSKNCSVTVSHITVLGAGIMGGGIAYQNASKGFSVLMKDISDSSLLMGVNEVKKLLTKSISIGKISNSDAKNILSRITPSMSYEGIKKTTIVIEAIIENKTIKSEVLAEIENKLPANAILSSNTSTISIDFLASNLNHPDRFCGMHFFNPVHVMPLVEIVRGKRTSDETIELAVAHATKLGKKPIIVNDCPGFLVNRILFPAIFAFDMMIVDGADFQQIDSVIEDWGWPMGPAYLIDVIGLDTAISCFATIISGYPNRMKDVYDVSPTRILCEKNRFGQKNKQGFYGYEEDDKGKPKKYFDKKVLQMLKAYTQESDLSNYKFDAVTILYRFMIPMCIEAALCLEEGIVDSPSEVDMSIVYGLGFPVFRGGLLRWMDEIGINNFCNLADKFAHLGSLYKPTSKMRKMAREDIKYYSF
ncbi:fatty acid oxidation complex subunit alpha FadB [Porticoccus sp.]|nr:fatty acid oxidation complex subunit alpha FadB [Porticoccus sp.]